MKEVVTGGVRCNSGADELPEVPVKLAPDLHQGLVFDRGLGLPSGHVGSLGGAWTHDNRGDGAVPGRMQEIDRESEDGSFLYPTDDSHVFRSNGSRSRMKGTP